MKFRKNKANNQLQKSVKSTCDITLERGIGNSTTIMLPKQNSSDGYIVDICPLNDTEDELNSGIKGAMITIIDPDYGHQLNLKGLKKLYKVSSAEAIVVEHLVQGKTYNEIADIRNVSPETIKTQVKSIYNKTGANSRSELFARAVKMSLPFS